MKTVLALILVFLTKTAFAQHYHYYHHNYHRHAYGSHAWVEPLIIGGIIGFVISKATQPPPPQIVYIPAGYPPPPVGFRYEQILDGNCNCYRWVLIQG